MGANGMVLTNNTNALPTQPRRFAPPGLLRYTTLVFGLFYLFVALPVFEYMRAHAAELIEWAGLPQLIFVPIAFLVCFLGVSAIVAYFLLRVPEALAVQHVLWILVPLNIVVLILVRPPWQLSVALGMLDSLAGFLLITHRIERVARYVFPVALLAALYAGLGQPACFVPTACRPLQALARAVVPSTAPRDLLAEEARLTGRSLDEIVQGVERESASAPRLVIEGYLGFNIIRYRSSSFGIRQSRGAFDPREYSPELHTDVFVGASSDEVMRAIERAVLGRQLPRNEPGKPDGR